MRAAASLAINATGAEAAPDGSNLRRDRFILVTDTGGAMNSILFAVFPALGTASFDLYLTTLPLTARVPADDAEMNAIELALVPSEMAVLAVTVPGESVVGVRGFAPGWYYCRQTAANGDAKRADLYPVALSALILV